MTATSVFISSTFQDLKQHRRAVWEMLAKFAVTVRGMEEFGARSTAPLETCLAEVGQSDVYVGIIAFRLGSIEARTGRSFTELEYGHAYEQQKQIMIYLADEETAIVPFTAIDTNPDHVAQLVAFKRLLRNRHTVDTFSTPEDLALKLQRDFVKAFTRPQVTDSKHESEAALKALRDFRLTPKRLNGTEVRLVVKFNHDPFPASRELCTHFNFEYGATVGVSVSIIDPADKWATEGLTELYATGGRIDNLFALRDQASAGIYAVLLFSEKTVTKDRAEFFGTTHLPPVTAGPIAITNSFLNMLLPVTVPAEGKIIMLFTKSVS